MRQISISDANKSVNKKNGKLYFNNTEILDTKEYKDDKIAALYMVRVYDKRGYPVIVTGLDLMKDGKIWLGSYPVNMWQNQRQVKIPAAFYENFDTIEHILNNICSDTTGKNWIIVEEEDFDQF